MQPTLATPANEERPAIVVPPAVPDQGSLQILKYSDRFLQSMLIPANRQNASPLGFQWDHVGDEGFPDSTPQQIFHHHSVVNGVDCI